MEYLSTYSSSIWKREMMRKYDETYSSYDELYKHEQLYKYRNIEEILKGEYEKILDAGCGTGLLLEFLVEKTKPKYYVGIDISVNMLKHAMNKLSKHKIILDLIQGDVEYLPFRSSAFSCSISITVFDNLYDPERGLKELTRITKRGGLIVLSKLKKGRLTYTFKFEGFEELNVPEDCKDDIYFKILD